MATGLESPFRIEIPNEKLELLKKRLEFTVLPDELTDAGRDYGVPLADIRRLVTRWKGGYDWRKHEAQLNEELPQYTRDLEVNGFGLFNIHYVHQRSDVRNAVPLLFVHGWPGSFLEVRKILPLLTQAPLQHPNFHVIAVGLPGFGFSTAPKKKGFGLVQYAELCHKLMISLGYNEYEVTQGGDWGFVITRKMAQMYGGKHVKAWHTNFPLATPPKPYAKPLLYLSHLFAKLSPVEKAGLERTQWFRTKGLGYQIEQSTQPQTLGYSLADSPVGLLAWIYEKLVNWTDGYKWSDDEVLTWVSIYWFSRAGPAASLRIYYECHAAFQDLEPINVPVGYSYFPKELVILPRRWLKAPNVVLESEHTTGGHFAAHETPELLVGDLRKMFGKNGPAAGIVPGQNGYT